MGAGIAEGGVKGLRSRVGGGSIHWQSAIKANQIGFIAHCATAFCGCFLIPFCTLSQTQSGSLNSRSNSQQHVTSTTTLQTVFCFGSVDNVSTTARKLHLDHVGALTSFFGCRASVLIHSHSWLRHSWLRQGTFGPLWVFTVNVICVRRACSQLFTTDVHSISHK